MIRPFKAYGSQNGQLHDFIWHLGGTLVPIVLNFIRNPIFTRIFTPEEFGYYSLVFLTFNYFTLTLFSWLSSNIWRYYYEYKDRNQLPVLFSNLGGLYLAGSLVLVVISSVWYFNVEQLLVKKLILFSFLYYVLNDITALYLVMIRLEKKTKEYNITQSLRAIINFAILCVLTFILKMRIEAMVLSFFIATILLIIYIYLKSVRNYPYFLPRLSLFQIKECKVFLTFGLVGLITNFTLMLLNNSDRYFVALFHSISEVGIYNQNYAIAYTSILALTTAFMNTINPNLNRTLTQQISNSTPVVARYMLIYFFALAPITFLIAFFTREINYILLGDAFRQGYSILSYVSVSLFLFGFSSFSGTKLKFSNRFKLVIAAYITSCVVNVILNYFLLQRFDYTWAAITTLLAFLCLYFILAISDRSVTLYFISNYLGSIAVSLLSLLIVVGAGWYFRFETVSPDKIIPILCQMALSALFLYAVNYVLFTRAKDSGHSIST